MAKTIKIGGRIESTETGNVVAGANAILDDTKGKKQNVINADVDAELLRLENAKQDNLTFDNAPTEGSTNPVTSGGVYTATLTLEQAIEAILLLIPSAASALNKLVDTDLMNSSIATNTATFRGTSASGLTEEQFLAWANTLPADNNDYVFWQTVDADGNTLFKRYKYVTGTGWVYEYTLNNSSFTAAQWAAIESGITAALVSKLNGLPNATELAQLFDGKQNVLTFDNVPISGSSNPVKSSGVYTAVGDEAQARSDADTILDGKISDEATARGNADELLQQAINGVALDVVNIQNVIPQGATSSNKLTDAATVSTMIALIVEDLDASFTITTQDQHVSVTLTQVDGKITSFNLITSDIASDQEVQTLSGQVDDISGDVIDLTNRMGTAETSISALQAAYAGLTQSDIIVGALPSSGVANKIYRVPSTNSYSDYMWNGSAFVLLATYNNAIDPVPMADSENLVESGGVYDEVNYRFISGNIYTSSLLHSGNMLIDNDPPYGYISLNQASYGICKTTKPIEIKPEYISLVFNGLSMNTGNQLKMRFATDGTDAGGTTEKLPLGINVTSGEINIAQYYAQGYRYFSIELTRGLSTWDESQVRLQLRVGRSMKTTMSNIIGMMDGLEVFNAGIVRDNKAIDSDYPHTVFAYNGYYLTDYLEIPSDAKYIAYKGVKSSIGSSPSCRFTKQALDSEATDAWFGVNLGDDYTIIDLSLYKEYRYFSMGVAREPQGVTPSYADVSIKFLPYESNVDEDEVFTGDNFVQPSTILKKNRVSVNFIFDDGWAEDPDVKAVFDEFGLKCGFAFINNGTYPQIPISNYLQWAKEGFELLAHNSEPLSTADEATIRASMVQAKGYVTNLGLICHGWVTPSSVLPEALTYLVNDYFEYGFTKPADDDPLTKDMKSYNFWRVHMQTMKTDYQSIIAAAIQADGMISVYAHSVEIDEIPIKWTLADLRTVLQYCVTNNIEVLTPYRSCLKLYEPKVNETQP